MGQATGHRKGAVTIASIYFLSRSMIKANSLKLMVADVGGDS